MRRWFGPAARPMAYVEDAARVARSAAGGYTRLLYLRPTGTDARPTDDELTVAMADAFAAGLRTRTWRGFHVCVCGERSGNCDWEVAGRFETNGLCVHYLRWHRSEVPDVELARVRGLTREP